MAMESDHNSDVPRDDGYGGYASIVGKAEQMWALLIIGFATVLFAPDVVASLQRLRWILNDSDTAITTLRYAGTMLFAAGLVERIILKLSRH